MYNLGRNKSQILRREIQRKNNSIMINESKITDPMKLADHFNNQVNIQTA